MLGNALLDSNLYDLLYNDNDNDPAHNYRRRAGFYTIFHLLLLDCTHNSIQIDVMINLLQRILKKADAFLVSKTLNRSYRRGQEKIRLIDLAKETDKKLEEKIGHPKCVVDVLASKFVGISPIELGNFRPENIERVKELLVASKYRGEAKSFDLAAKLAKNPTEIKPAEIKDALKLYEEFIPRTTKKLTPDVERFWLDRLNKLLKIVSSSANDPDKEANLNLLHAFLGRIYWLRYQRDRHPRRDGEEYKKHFQAISLNKLEDISPFDLLRIEEFYKQEKPQRVEKFPAGQITEEAAQRESKRLQCTYKQLIVLRAGVIKGDPEAKQRAELLTTGILNPDKELRLSDLPSDELATLPLEKEQHKEEKKENMSQEKSLDDDSSNELESKDEVKPKELLEDIQKALSTVAQQSFEAGVAHYNGYLARRKTETRSTSCASFLFGYSASDYEARKTISTQLGGAETAEQKEKVLNSALTNHSITHGWLRQNSKNILENLAEFNQLTIKNSR